VQIESEHRLILVTDSLQDPTLWSCAIQGVPVDVDTLEVAALVDLRPIQVEHRNHQEGEAVKDRRRFRLVGSGEQKMGDVEQSGSRGRLISVHLGPQEYGARPVPQGDQINGPSLNGSPHLFQLDLPGIELREPLQLGGQLSRSQAGSRGLDKALLRPALPELAGCERGRCRLKSEGENQRECMHDGHCRRSFDLPHPSPCPSKSRVES